MKFVSFMDEGGNEFVLGLEDVQHIIGDNIVWGDDSSSDDSRDHLINNNVNIARGFSNISSPEEDIIKFRGRVNKVKPVTVDETSKDSLLLHLATRKSPRKPVSRSFNDFADDYFRSPTPKKARGTPKKSSKVTPIKSSSDYKVNPKKAAFRKRLTLNSSDLIKSDGNSSRTDDSNSPSPSLPTVSTRNNSSTSCASET